MATPDITLYTWPTPNGLKISIVLEELGLPYKVRPVNLESREQKERWFLKFNPNGRLPAITDGNTRVFESGAIMLYLTGRYDTARKISYAPEDLPGYTEQLSWLMWQMGGLGPMQGQAHHFQGFAPVRSDWGIQRYTDEAKRLYSVLEARLQEVPYLAGEKFSIADIACYCWVRVSPNIIAFNLGDWPAVQRWHDRIMEREAVKTALRVPEAPITEAQFTIIVAQKRKEMMERNNADLH
ncbi:glutathione S-transferase [Talaromyces proteolyticus]|uniref:Glutathione S-transferase n=1 Tax=Talaromyces proteolyticus TaxID=1131652 RepID=A0AAD4KPU8_9EURO|nr:glutathione S-transferase [Talaromyces proteolyticus]KAH8696535.1 glutathione S-transferase [Talaromyces proteolyticus]